MADPRFFLKSGTYTLARIAEVVSGRIEAGDPQKKIDDLQTLDQATQDDISFFDNRKYKEKFQQSRAGACFVNEDMARLAPSDMALIIVKNPYLAYAMFANFLYPDHPDSWYFKDRISNTACIHKTARVSETAVIGNHVEIEEGCVISAGAVLHHGVKIGKNTWVGANAVIECALIGEHVLIHPGVKIGQRGFGFAPTAEKPIKIPQLGRVIIGNDVEIGANTTIDRGALQDTVVGHGSMIDNLVQIGHNVKIGKNCIIVSQVGISGSTEIGDFVVMGGQVGVAGHLKIGSGAQIASKSGIHKDIAPGEIMGGYPAVPIKDWHRQSAVLKRLSKKTSS